MSRFAVVILTYNEEIHVERAIKSALLVSDDVYIVDSYSSDATKEICSRFPITFLENTFVSHGNQRRYCLNTPQIKNDWIFFLDADEYLDDELIEELRKLNFRDEIVGYNIMRKFIFNNKWIKHGGYYPKYFLRLFDKTRARCEREINEHVEVVGKVGFVNGNIVDHNLNSIFYWVEKHNIYSSKEATSYLTNRKGITAKKRVFWKFPLWLQPHLYFVYRVFFRGGWRDGLTGVLYHFLHAYIMVGLTMVKIYMGKIK